MIIVFILEALGGLITLIGIIIVGVMIFDRIGEALARLATWFLRRF